MEIVAALFLTVFYGWVTLIASTRLYAFAMVLALHLGLGDEASFRVHRTRLWWEGVATVLLGALWLQLFFPNDHLNPHESASELFSSNVPVLGWIDSKLGTVLFLGGLVIGGALLIWAFARRIQDARWLRATGLYGASPKEPNFIRLGVADPRLVFPLPRPRRTWIRSEIRSAWMLMVNIVSKELAGGPWFEDHQLDFRPGQCIPWHGLDQYVENFNNVMTRLEKDGHFEKLEAEQRAQLPESSERPPTTTST